MKLQYIARTESDNSKIIDMLNKIKFFQNHKSITPVDLREIAQYMNYQELDAGSSIMEVGDKAENFYIILSGTVSVQIRNEIIESWDWARSVYNALKKWKKEEFDKRVD